jgi:hypothetical protein
MRRLAILLLLLMPAFAPRAQDAAAVRIFRCTDAAGRETLRDTPCPKGQAQQVREMIRPKDAPPRPAPPAAPAPPLAAPAPTSTATPLSTLRKSITSMPFPPSIDSLS